MRAGCRGPSGPPTVPPLGIALVEFLACAALIGVAGTRLVRYGDIVGAKTGLTGSWVGMVLIGVVTSLPELMTGLSAVALAGVPDIAVGNALGACIVNLLLFVLLDLLHRKESIYGVASRGHTLAAAVGAAGFAIVGGASVLHTLGHDGSIAHVGFYSPLLLVAYAIAMRLIYRHERQEVEDFAVRQASRYPDVSLRRALGGYGLAAAVVVAAGTWLPFAGERIADETGWANSFVGSVIVSIATTIPETVVTLTALRIGAVDVAIGNLLGSNLFNIAIIAIDDLAFPGGALLAHAAPVHALSAFAAILMTSVVAAALVYRAPRGRTGAMTFANATLVAAYLLNGYALFASAR